jgi:intracellular septation protein A
MKNLLRAGKLLLLDMASTFFLLVFFLVTKNMALAVALGITVGVAQIGWSLLRKQPIDTMQYLSLFLVVGSGLATLITRDPRFVMLKPSIIYVIVGIVMLKPGWLNRYLPPIAIELVPDVAYIFGFIWAALMFISAALNVVVAMSFGVVAWSVFMSAFAIVSKVGLFVIQYVTMRMVGLRRHRPRAVLAPG